MLNERKIRLMMKLAEYETGKGKEDLKIAGYYRSDYLGRALLKNFLLVTIGYGLILILIGAYYADFLLDTIHQMDLLMLGTAVLGGYIIVLTVYSVVTYAVCALRYSKAERSAEWYERRLAQLEKFYGGENAGSQKKKAGGVMYDLAIGSKRKNKRDLCKIRYIISDYWKIYSGNDCF